jgi:pSer/pThr/pTyr-binding forkhead associated (FHA) protein
MAVCPNGHDSASDDFCDVCGMRISRPDAVVAGPPTTASGHGSPGAYGPPGGWPAPGPASADEPCPNCGTARTGQFCEACGYNFAGPRLTPGPPAPAPAGSYSRPVPASPPQAPPPGPGTGGYSWSQPVPSAPSAPSVPAPPAATVPPPVGETAAGAPSMSSFPYPQATWTAVVGADRTYYEQVQAVTGPEGTAVTFPSYCAERRFQLVGNQMRIGRRSVSRGLAPEIDLTGPPADPGISRLHAVLIATQDGNWAVLDPGSANGTLVNGSEIGVGDQVPLRDGDRINLGAWTAITVHRGLGNSQPAGGRRRVTTDDPRH